jgi:release factor glutamine methyltransferase
MLRAVTEDLRAAGIDSAPQDARHLVALATGLPVARLSIEAQAPVTQDQWQILGDVLPDRLARKPLSHILRRRAFWRHDFEVTPHVLDPRPETEILVERALAGPFSSVLDLGTGSGCILASLLDERPTARGVGVDLSDAALDVARRNARKIGVDDRATFVTSDWYTEIQGRYDLIVSNPPYIALDEMSGLAPELAHEPRMALTDEQDGLSAYRTIIEGATGHLRPNGRLMVEIGPTQAAAVMALFRAAGFFEVAIHGDLDGRDRVVGGVFLPQTDR